MPIGAKAVERVQIPKNVKIEFDSMFNFKVTGPNGTITRTLYYPKLAITRDGDELVISFDMPKKKDKAIVGTFASHLKNMCLGVTEGFQYTMKVVYSHFPIKVVLKGTQVSIENFLGEKKARSANLVGKTKILIKGNDLTIIGTDVEEVGQSVANIERATKIKKRDPRVFQDGIYLVNRK